MTLTYSLTANSTIQRSDGACIPNDPSNRDYAEYLAWVAEGNTPDPAPEAPPPTIEDRIALGLVITSAGTPALNGTYLVTPDVQRGVIAIYVAIKGGDGLPGGGSTFNYFYVADGPREFNETNFLNLAKAVSDYVYRLTEAALMASSEWPDNTATIP